jgi:hypothetical protein
MTVTIGREGRLRWPFAAPDRSNQDHFSVVCLCGAERGLGLLSVFTVRVANTTTIYGMNETKIAPAQYYRSRNWGGIERLWVCKRERERERDEIEAIASSSLVE